MRTVTQVVTLFERHCHHGNRLHFRMYLIYVSTQDFVSVHNLLTLGPKGPYLSGQHHHTVTHLVSTRTTPPPRSQIFYPHTCHRRLGLRSSTIRLSFIPRHQICTFVNSRPFFIVKSTHMLP